MNRLSRTLRILCLALFLTTGADLFLFPMTVPDDNPTSGMAPFLFDGNRVYAELAFVRPDGTLHRALAFVDLGSPAMIVSKALFNALGLDKKPLTFLVATMPVRLEAGSVTFDTSLPYPIADNRQIEAVLPAGVVKNYQFVIDYAGHTVILALPGTLKPEGVPVPIHLDPQTGLAAVDATINGKSYPVTIDNGSAYSWLGKATVQEWLKMHPDWERGRGAVGTSNMRMEDDGIESTGILTRIPEVRLGSLRIADVGALAIGPTTGNSEFIDWYRKKNAVPVIGWLGGNVLQGFRIMIDYPNHTSYWLKQRDLDPHDLDQVGVTLATRNGAYFVTAVVTQNGKPTVEGVHVGDKIVQIGGLQTSIATWGAIFSAMHGKPGETRSLVLQRQGKTVIVQAKVAAF
jgi:hypothetical protein